MITYSEIPDSNIAELVVDGFVSQEDFDEISGRMTALIERHGRIRLLEEIKALGGFDLSIIPDDVRFAFHHLKDISHCAVVGERVWLEWLTRVLDPLLSCEVRYFERAEIEAARAWLRDAPD